MYIYCNKATGTLNLMWTGFQWNRRNAADSTEDSAEIFSSPISKCEAKLKTRFLGFYKKKLYISNFFVGAWKTR